MPRRRKPLFKALILDHQYATNKTKTSKKTTRHSIWKSFKLRLRCIYSNELFWQYLLHSLSLPCPADSDTKPLQRTTFPFPAMLSSSCCSKPYLSPVIKCKYHNFIFQTCQPLQFHHIICQWSKSFTDLWWSENYNCENIFGEHGFFFHLCFGKKTQLCVISQSKALGITHTAPHWSWASYLFAINHLSQSPTSFSFISYHDFSVLAAIFQLTYISVQEQ